MNLEHTRSLVAPNGAAVLLTLRRWEYLACSYYGFTILFFFAATHVAGELIVL